MDRWMRRGWKVILAGLLIAAAVKFVLPVKSPVMFEQTQVNREIVVYISGAVKSPGLLNLALDSRLDDALKIAGLTNDADVDALNPAQKLKDGQKIIIPHKEGTQSSESSSMINTFSSSGKASPGTGPKVNINSAGIGELDTIPGIGPALAQRIVDYREQNGLFSSPEDLQEVSGIGPKTYEKMAPYITVGR